MDKTSRSPSDIRRIAEYLDSKYSLFGFKFGWDGILGLIPGAGDIITNVFSFFILYRASQLGCPPSVLLRMGLNLVVDNFLDAIPVIGNIFDFIWKANNKNVDLLNRYLEHPQKTTRSSRFLVGLTLLFLATVMIASVVITFLIIIWIIETLRQMFY